jgi:hypothetical protein
MQIRQDRSSTVHVYANPATVEFKTSHHRWKPASTIEGIGANRKSGTVVELGHQRHRPLRLSALGHKLPREQTKCAAALPPKAAAALTDLRVRYGP